MLVILKLCLNIVCPFKKFLVLIVNDISLQILKFDTAWDNSDRKYYYNKLKTIHTQKMYKCSSLAVINCFIWHSIQLRTNSIIF